MFIKSSREVPARLPSSTNPLIIFLVTVTCVVCSGSIFAAAPDRWVEGQIIVKPRAGLPAARFEKILHNSHGQSVRRLKQLGAHIVRVNPHAEDAVIRALSRNPHIEYAEKDMLVEISQITPNDPAFPQQWHLAKMQAPTAWTDTVGEGVTVAVLDTGIEASHPDLSGKLVPGWNSVSRNNDTSPVMWHGTGVAGVVAAASNNGVGISSVAWGARIMPIRVSNTSDGVAQWSALADGILWAADQGADVVNMSYDVAVGAYLLRDAAQYFRNRGGVVVASAGNANTDGGHSDDPYMITVAASTIGDAKAGFSNYGNNIDVAAPGQDIYTTYINGSYANAWGTSFASPATAGVVALIMAANPSLSPDEVEAVLEQSADDLVEGTDWHPYFGHGRVNAAAAVRLAGQLAPVDGEAPSVTIFSPPADSTVAGGVLVEVDALDDTGVAEVSLFANGQLVGTDLTLPYRFSWDSTQVSDGSVVFTAEAVDSSGNEGVSDGVTVYVKNYPSVEDDEAPAVSITHPTNGSSVSRTVNISVSAHDDAGVTVLSVYVDGALKCTLADSDVLSCSWNTRKVSDGPHSIVAVAEDAAGNSGELEIQVSTGGGGSSGGPGRGKKK